MLQQIPVIQAWGKQSTLWGKQQGFPLLHSSWKALACSTGCFCFCFPQVVQGVVRALPQSLHRLVVLISHQKAPNRGLPVTVDQGCNRLKRVASETHHIGHCGEIGVQIGVEGSVVVVDGAVGVFEAVAGENTDNSGSGRNFLSAFQQARN